MTILTIPEVARILRVTPKVVREQCARGCIPARKIGGSWRIEESLLAQWFQSGTPLAVLKELGGWASMDMVFRYAHLGESHLAEWAKNSTYGTNTAQSGNRESLK